MVPVVVVDDDDVVKEGTVLFEHLNDIIAQSQSNNFSSKVRTTFSK